MNMYHQTGSFVIVYDVEMAKNIVREMEAAGILRDWCGNCRWNCYEIYAKYFTTKTANYILDKLGYTDIRF